MATIWISSDHHIGHTNIWKTFKKPDGSSLRPFTSDDEMREIIINRHNEVVQPKDHVYFLGDFTMKDEELKVLARMHGHKRLILGNHDDWNMRKYIPHFEKIYGVRRLDTFILSHFPIHPDTLSGKLVGNVHGHTHANIIQDPRYLNVCVECINYTPITFEDAKNRIKKQIEQGRVF